MFRTPYKDIYEDANGNLWTMGHQDKDEFAARVTDIMDDRDPRLGVTMPFTANAVHHVTGSSGGPWTVFYIEDEDN